MFVGIAINLTGRLLSSTSPASLFANGEVGVWYDPSQINTLYQDSAGTTPVTAPNQPVGLMLDKSQGATLGPELVTNGTFTSGTTGWTGVNSTLSVVSGALRITCTVGTPYAYTAITTVIGKKYLLNVTLVADAMSGNSFIYAGTTAGAGDVVNINISSTPGKYATVFTATTTTTYIALSGSSSALATQTLDWDNISCKLTTGNPATQTVDTQRPIYGINPIVGTRNLLTYTEQFDNAAWSKTGATVSANTATSPDGSTTADLLAQTAVTSEHYTEQTGLQTTAGTYTASYYVKAGTVASFQIMVVHIGQGGSTSTSRFLISAGVITYDVSSGIISGASATGVGGGWYRCSVTYTLTSGVTSHRTRMYAGLSGIYLGDTVNNLLIWGAQLEVSSTVTAYQKVVSQYEVTQAGVQSVSYLAFDGVDDGMVTPTITPNTDKVQVFAGVRKLSDAATSIIVESSVLSNTSNPGSIFLRADSGPIVYNLRSTGSIATNLLTPLTYPAPITNVLTGIGEIVTDTLQLRVNGTTVATSSADQGSGNYLAYPLYIGSRAGTSWFFNGRLYSLITRFGPNLTTGQITSTETWVNGETGAY